MKYASKKELIQAAKAAGFDIDNAETKEQVIHVFRKHLSAIGYKTLAKLLMGQDPEVAVKKWASHIEE